MIRGFLIDLGGVLLSNGWDHRLRALVAKKYSLDYEEFSKRHESIFDFYERGKMTFEEYLDWTIFHVPRAFSKRDLIQFILAEAKAYPEMIEFIKKIKNQFGLKICALSNEGKELALDRVKRFDLESFIDFFVISSFVGLRKPDADIYKLAISLTQIPPNELCYIDDRALFVERAKEFGLHAICHESMEKTQRELVKILGANMSIEGTPLWQQRKHEAIDELQHLEEDIQNNDIGQILIDQRDCFDHLTAAKNLAPENEKAKIDEAIDAFNHAMKAIGTEHNKEEAIASLKKSISDLE